MSYRHRKQGSKDANHAAIAQVLRAAGCWVEDTSSLGGGAPDLWVCHGRECTGLWLEVKDGRKPPSARKLTPAEDRWHLGVRARGGRVETVTDVQGALFALGLVTSKAVP